MRAWVAAAILGTGQIVRAGGGFPSDAVVEALARIAPEGALEHLECEEDPAAKMERLCGREAIGAMRVCLSESGAIGMLSSRALSTALDPRASTAVLRDLRAGTCVPGAWPPPSSVAEDLARRVLREAFAAEPTLLPGAGSMGGARGRPEIDAFVEGLVRSQSGRSLLAELRGPGARDERIQASVLARRIGSVVRAQTGLMAVEGDGLLARAAEDLRQVPAGLASDPTVAVMVLIEGWTARAATPSASAEPSEFLAHLRSLDRRASPRDTAAIRALFPLRWSEAEAILRVLR